MKKNKIGWIILIALFVVIAGLLFLLVNPEILKTFTGSTKPSSLQIHLPSTTVREQLVTETTLRFGRAIKAKDLSLFRDSTAEEFKQAFSREEFERAFSGFIRQNINLLAVKNYRPLFTSKPKLTTSGTLILQGYFPTKPSRVKFDYKYVWRGNTWKLSGINVVVQPAGDS